MSSSLRRRGGRAQQQHHVPTPSPSPPAADDTDSDVELEGHRQEEEEQDLDGNDDDETLGDDLVGLAGEEEEEGEEGDEELDDEEGDGLGSPNHAGDTSLPNLDPPPPYLREISTLASWTVSSSKPGCSIPQLRHPNTNLFWQSDGPQPHYLNIHFFKLVRIVGLRLYLDFEQDESYTPTKIIFLAGSGLNDLQEWGEMRLENPRGWIWADFSGVGDPDSDDDDDDDGYDDEDNNGGATTGHRPQRLLAQASALNGTRRTGNDAASSDSENAAPAQEADVTDLDLETPVHRQQQQQHTPFPPYPAPTHGRLQITPQTVPPSHNHNLRHYTHAVTPTQHQPSTPSLPQTMSRPQPRAPFASLSPNPAPHPIPSSTRSTPKLPVLRAHLVQIKILENHQNGKDTHLRGLQIFARNDEDGHEAGGHGAGSNTTKGVTSGAQGMELLKREKKERKRREEVLELSGGIMGMGLGSEGVLR